MALPDRDVVVMVGDGSYLMLNSEIATSIALQQKLIIVVLDNRVLNKRYGQAFLDALPKCPQRVV